MQEGNSIQFQEQLDQMVHDARLRRSADLGDWLKLIFKKQSQSRSHKAPNLSIAVAGLHRPAT